MRLLMLFVGVLALASSPIAAQVVSVKPESIKVTIEDNVEFKCETTNVPGNSIEWAKNDFDGNKEYNIIASTVGFEIHTYNSTDMMFSILRIFNVEYEDRGFFACILGENSAQGSLEVTYDGIVEIKGSRVIVMENDMNFTCFIDGNSSVEVTWKKGDETLPSETVPNVQIKGSMLFIKMASTANSGTYTCSGMYNDAVSVEGSIVLGGEIRVKAPISAKFTEGERARFECVALYPEQEDPKPTFTWVINTLQYNMTLDADNLPERFTIEDSKRKVGTVLHMVNVVKEDRGNYTCIMNSPVTEVTHTVFLRVRDRLAALWPFIGIMSEVILLIIIIFIHEKCTQGDDFGEEDEEDEEVAEPIKEKEKISLDGEGDMRMRTSNQ